MPDTDAPPATRTGELPPCDHSAGETSKRRRWQTPALPLGRHRQTTDLVGSGQVGVQQVRGHLQELRDIVKPERRVITWQHRRRIDVNRQQVADRVLVFDPIQAMEDWRPTWVRLSRRGEVQLRFQPRHKVGVFGVIRSRSPNGRHRTSTELPQDLFPDRRTGAHPGDVQRVQRESRGLQSLVVAGDTVLIEKSSLGRHRSQGRGR